MDKLQDIFDRGFKLIENIPWDLQYSFDFQGTDFGDSKTRIYLVDTHTGWYAHAAVSIASFKEAADYLHRSGITHDEMAKIANGLIIGLRDADNRSAERAEQALSVVALWLADTDTFRQLSASQTLGTHVFAFSYTTKNSSMLLRPTAMMDHSVNFCPPEEVLDITRQIVSMDSKNDQSYVGQLLKTAGGALLSSLFD